MLTFGTAMKTYSMRYGEENQWMNDFLVLADSPATRNQAQARQALPSGTVIATVPALSAILLPEEKSRRCDHCFRRPETKARRCTGCAEYWYCGPSCRSISQVCGRFLPHSTCIRPEPTLEKGTQADVQISTFFPIVESVSVVRAS